MAEYTEDLCEGGTPFGTNSHESRGPDQAFNNDVFPTSTDWTDNVWQTSDYSETGSVGYQFTSPKIIKKYTLGAVNVNINQMPSTWTFEGSNDGVSWDILDTVANEPAFTEQWEQREYLITNDTAYDRYRLNITAAVYGNGRATIGEIEMMEKALTEINPNRPDLVTKLYNLSSKKGNLRGKAKAGFVRPTISQFFTSKNFSEVLSFNPENSPIGTFVNGGYYFGTIDIGEKTYALVCADKASGENSSLQWKTSSNDTPGTTSLVDGFSNTAAMITAGASAHPAANFCNSLTIGGNNDWYLPAKDELDLLYTNHVALESAGAGTFEDDPYWSSTEYSDHGYYAWRQNFRNGSPWQYAKGSTYYVRAIRRFEV
jgi:hypothetical protein